MYLPFVSRTECEYLCNVLNIFSEGRVPMLMVLAYSFWTIMFRAK